MLRRAALPLSLAFVVLACSACEWITGVPVEPCEPEMLEQVPIVATDSLAPPDSLPVAYAGGCSTP